MASLIILLTLICIATSLPHSSPYGRVGVSQTVTMISSEGYAPEIHNVLTDDGYILEVHRIPRGRNYNPQEKRPVVFVMHGLLASSLGFIALGPNRSIGYQLADAGFDVWMGNARGTRDSRHHISLDPDHPDTRKQFWDFSWHEIGSIDVPAMIDYILIITGQEALHYVGHSQGGTSFLVMASSRPEYNKKILTANLLAGVGYMENFPDEDLVGFAQLTNTIYNLATALGIYEVFPPTSDVADPAPPKADLCTGDVSQRDLCVAIGMRDLMEHEDIVHYIAGAAMKQIAHYGQNIRDKTFRLFDYGAQKNLEVYGQTSPPAYDLSLITANVTMHYSMNDNLLDERDVLNMAAVMPNTVAVRVPRNSFTHNDFIVAEDAKDLVTDLVIDKIWDLEDSRGELTGPEAAALTGSAKVLSSGVLLQVAVALYYLVL